MRAVMDDEACERVVDVAQLEELLRVGVSRSVSLCLAVCSCFNVSASVSLCLYVLASFPCVCVSLYLSLCICVCVCLYICLCVFACVCVSLYLCGPGVVHA